MIRVEGTELGDEGVLAPVQCHLQIASVPEVLDALELGKCSWKEYKQMQNRAVASVTVQSRGPRGKAWPAFFEGDRFGTSVLYLFCPLVVCPMSDGR